MPQRIIILGAGGYTAGLILEKLSPPGIEIILAGRREDPARGIRALDIQDPAQVEALVRPGDIVINCVGPFNLYSRGLAQQLAAKAVVYLDLCGEQSFVSFSYQTLDSIAKKHDALLLHACAFESFLAVMLASLNCKPDTLYDEIASYYWFDNNSPSPGTALTMRLTSHWENEIYENGQWVTKIPKTGLRPFEFPEKPKTNRAVFVPYPEIEFFPRMFKTQNAGSYFAMSEGEATMFQSVTGGAKRGVEEILKQHKQRQRSGPDASERPGQIVGIAVEARSIQGLAQVQWLTGVDPYGLSAAIIVWCCARLLEMKTRPSGVLSPSQVFSADAFFKYLQSWPEFHIHLGHRRSELTNP